jgi:Ras-related protein Rab-21
MVLSLVGNKIDLDARRTVSREEAYLYSTSIGGNYFETSAVTDQGIEQVFISTALGLIQLSNDGCCSSIHRYESMDSIPNSYQSSMLSPGTELNGAVQIGIPVDAHIQTTATGRLERPTWSIDNIAHGSEGKIGWCCF